MTWCSNCGKNTETHHEFSMDCCVDCGKVTIESKFIDVRPRERNRLFYPVKEKIWCSFCGLKCDTYHQDTTHYLCCVYCGKVVNENLGIIRKGEGVINELIRENGIYFVNHAVYYFEIAVECGFTRGRKMEQVAVACLYLACRENAKPFLLIEFACDLSCNVYRLGILYLQLCQLFDLQDHPVVQNPVDPTFFMHRYTSELMKDDNNNEVCSTALHLAIHMKRDWIMTRRTPSGICAAAIYVSSMLHGYNFSKKNVVEAIQICDETLSKRLIEFENTESASLTIDELTQHATYFNKKVPWPSNVPKKEVVCEHKSSETVRSGSGLCSSITKKCYIGLCVNCYLEFLEGSQPSAFQPGDIIGEKIEFAAQVVASKKMKAKRKRELEAKPPTLAACQHFKKKLSSKINFDAWTRLFDDEEPSLEKNVSSAKRNEIRSDDDDSGDNDDDDNEDVEGDSDGVWNSDIERNYSGEWNYDEWKYDDEWKPHDGYYVNLNYI